MDFGRLISSFYLVHHVRLSDFDYDVYRRFCEFPHRQNGYVIDITLDTGAFVGDANK